jgi:hypothetical protein
VSGVHSLPIPPAPTERRHLQLQSPTTVATTEPLLRLASSAGIREEQRPNLATVGSPCARTELRATSGFTSSAARRGGEEEATTSGSPPPPWMCSSLGRQGKGGRRGDVDTPAQGSPNCEPAGFLNRKYWTGIPAKPTGIPIGGSYQVW